MPFYNDLRPYKDSKDRDFIRIDPNMSSREKMRTIDGLLRLKPFLKNGKAGSEATEAKKGVPQRKTEENLLIASWNLVSFGAGDYRTTEAMYYLAEMIACFDLIAIQEVKPHLNDLNRLIRILGSNWAYMVNDAMGGDAGNDERFAYVYNTDRVRPSGVAGEISPWDELRGDLGATLTDLKRPAYMTGFVTGWKDFALVNLHLHPGEKDERIKDGVTLPADSAIRQEEVRLLLAALADRKEQLWTDNLVLVGDMNFYRSEDGPTIDLIHAAGYWESAGLVGKTTNMTVNPRDAETYDRMFFNGTKRDEDRYFRIAVDDQGEEQGGVLDIFAEVYRDEDWPDYRIEMSQKHSDKDKGKALLTDDAAAWKYYRDTFRKRQLSDHYPIWVELSVDDALTFLAEKRKEIEKDLRREENADPLLG